MRVLAGERVAPSQRRGEESHFDTIALEREAAPDRKVDKPSISVVGLGYVGAVSMACLSHLGFRMLGVDIAAGKIDAINAGRSPIVEEGLGELLAEGVARGRIAATDNLVAAVLQTDVTLISVGTPTAADGSCDLTFVRKASKAIGRAIAMKRPYHVVVLRCSVPPGTTLEVVAREIEHASGKRLGPDFGVCFNPEFLREGVAVADFFAPPKTVVGANDERAATAVSKIYRAVEKDVIVTSIAAAEMVKYVDNVWHAAKVAFGNEVGRICKALKIDSHDVIDIFVRDTKLNLSPYYLKPGFAFGGSCLPKEVRAVGRMAEELQVSVPLIGSLLRSNSNQIAEAMRFLEPFSGRRIGFLGVTFKPGTDDLRESPALDLISELLRRGETVRVYDPNVERGPILRGQIDYVRHAVPRHARVLEQLEAILVPGAAELVAACDVVVVCHATDEFRSVVANRSPQTHVVDLVRLTRTLEGEETYQGIAW